MDLEIAFSSSRNWDDEGFESSKESTYSPIFMWSSKEQHPSVVEINIMFLGLKGAGTSFLSCNFPNKTLIGTIALPENSMKNKVLGSTECQCGIYKTQENPSMILLLCYQDIPADRAFAWTSCLFQHIHPLKVCILGSILDHKYISPDSELRFPLLKKLGTQQDKEDICTYLEPPNFVEDISAAVLEHCERRRIQASLFLSLEHSTLLEVVTLEAFEPVLLYFGFPTVATKEKYHQIVEITRRPNPLFI